jgi:hypothetical protein
MAIARGLARIFDFVATMARYSVARIDQPILSSILPQAFAEAGLGSLPATTRDSRFSQQHAVVLIVSLPLKHGKRGDCMEYLVVQSLSISTLYICS